MDTEALIEWFFAAPHEREALEAEARSGVTTWRWFAGACNPHDPEPLRAARRGLKHAKETEAGAPGSWSVPTLEVGLGADGRARVELAHATGRLKPTCKIWLPRPGGIAAVAFEQAGYGAPSWVKWLTLDAEARVLATEVWGSNRGWSCSAPTTTERSAACEPPFVTSARELYTWADGRLTRVEVHSLVPHFTFEQEIEYGARGAVKVFQVRDGKRRPERKA